MIAVKRAPAGKKTGAPARTRASGGKSKTEEVIAAAVRLVAAEGEQALGWNRVAQELGIKPPSLYNHLRDAADLERRVAIHAWTRLAQETEQAVGRAKRPADHVRAIAQAYRAFAHAEPGLFAVASRTRIAPDDPDFAPASRALFALFGPPLEALAVPVARRVHAIRILRACVHGFVELERAGQFALDTPVEASFTALVAALPALLATLR